MKKIFLLMFLPMMFVNSQTVLDKIVAVVDNEIILKSELDYQVNFTTAKENLDATDAAIQNRILDQMIEERLLYAQAELDSVTVSNEQVTSQLENQLNFFIRQYGSEENVEKVYGMSIDKIRRELRDDVKKSLMAQTLQQQKFGAVEVSRREVEEFYNANKDSLGIIPERFTLQHIFVNPRGGERVKTKAKNFMRTIIDSLNAGVDFGELAKRYSEDPGSASRGGDLGYVKRGVFFPEFEAAAYSLRAGERSGIIESPVGYHIIELLDRRGESIHTRHILVKIKSDDEADLQAIELLSEIRDSLLNGVNTIGYYAAKYSDDENSAKLDAELGVFEISQLDDKMKEYVYKLEKGEISFPKRLEIDETTYGFHIVKMKNRVREHVASIEKDYEDIKRIAVFNKKQKLYKAWVQEIKDKIFWEVRI